MNGVAVVRGAVTAVVVAVGLGCSPRTSPSPPAPSPAVASASAASTAPAAPAPAAPASAAGSDPAAAPSGAGPHLALDDALHVVFPDPVEARVRAAACADGDDTARMRCLLAARFGEDPAALPLAEELWTSFGVAAGVEVAHTMDGGYRGLIRIVPAVPVRADRKHLAWVVAAMRDFDAFFAGLGSAEASRPYRFRALSFRFMRSVARRTPTAYAHDWTIAYNLSGSLLVSEDATRETLFHEIFHLNDGARAWWSRRVLASIFDRVVAKCGTTTTCLAPYAPSDTMVRGGTYYAFQPGNGVVEYAAELALRYYRENRAVLRDGAGPRPFKCGPAENALAWDLVKDEFFGGADKTPPCGR